jgi:hypothetical protein
VRCQCRITALLENSHPLLLTRQVDRSL